MQLTLFFNTHSRYLPGYRYYVWNPEPELGEKTGSGNADIGKYGSTGTGNKIVKIRSQNNVKLKPRLDYSIFVLFILLITWW